MSGNGRIRKRRRGFTAVEMILTVVIMGIVLMIATPNFRIYYDTGRRLNIQEKHKMVVVAIQSWVQDNRVSDQRPGDFDVENSQGYTVPKYLSDKEFTVDSGSGKTVLRDDNCIIRFENGVLESEDSQSGKIVAQYGVFESEDTGTGLQLKDFDFLRGINHLTGETSEEYNVRIKDKKKKKLLLREDNVL